LFKDQIKILKTQVSEASGAGELVSSLSETASDMLDLLYIKWGFFTQTPGKFLNRPQTYLASPTVHIKPCTHLALDVKRVAANGKAVEHWFGLILANQGFRIRDRERISSKNGEFYRYKSDTMSVRKSIKFCELLLATVASSSAELFKAWIEFEADNSRNIQNYIVYGSWDSFIKASKRVEETPIPSDIEDQFILSVLRRCATVAATGKSASAISVRYDFHQRNNMGGGRLRCSDKFEGRLKLDKVKNSTRILVIGLENMNVIRAFTNLMALKLTCHFTLVDAKTETLSHAKLALPDPMFRFINDLVEAHDFGVERFDVIFSLISGRVTTLFVAAIAALRASPSSLLLVTSDVLKKFQAMQFSPSSSATLFWNVHRRSQAHNRDDSEDIVVATNRRGARRNVVIDDEAVESSGSGSGEDDSNDSDESSNQTPARLGDSIGFNYTEKIKNILSFSVVCNEFHLKTIIMDDLNNKLWTARTSCQPFMALLELRKTIVIPIYGFEITIPMAFSFRVSKSGSENLRSLTELSNHELSEVVAKFVFVAAIVYDFVIKHLPHQFRQLDTTKNQYSNFKSAEVFKYLKQTHRKFQLTQPAMEVPKQTNFHFNRKIGEANGGGEDDELENEGAESGNRHLPVRRKVKTATDEFAGLDFYASDNNEDHSEKDNSNFMPQSSTQQHGSTKPSMRMPELEKEGAESSSRQMSAKRKANTPTDECAAQAFYSSHNNDDLHNVPQSSTQKRGSEPSTSRPAASQSGDANLVELLGLFEPISIVDEQNSNAVVLSFKSKAIEPSSDLMKWLVDASNNNKDDFIQLFVKSNKPKIKLFFFRKNDKTYYSHTKPDGYCGFRINYQIHQMIEQSDFTIVSDKSIKSNDHAFLKFLKKRLPAPVFNDIKCCADKGENLPKDLWYGDKYDKYFSTGLNQTLFYSDTCGGNKTDTSDALLRDEYKYLFIDSSKYNDIVQELSARPISIVCNARTHYYFLKPLLNPAKQFKRLVNSAILELLRRRELVLSSLARQANIPPLNCDMSKRQRCENDAQWMAAASEVSQENRNDCSSGGGGISSSGEDDAQSMAAASEVIQENRNDCSSGGGGISSSGENDAQSMAAASEVIQENRNDLYIPPLNCDMSKRQRCENDAQSMTAASEVSQENRNDCSSGGGGISSSGENDAQSMAAASEVIQENRNDCSSGGGGISSSGENDAKSMAAASEVSK
jgi:hypothetical protein